MYRRGSMSKWASFQWVAGNNIYTRLPFLLPTDSMSFLLFENQKDFIFTHRFDVSSHRINALRLALLFASFRLVLSLPSIQVAFNFNLQHSTVWCGFCVFITSSFVQKCNSEATMLAHENTIRRIGKVPCFQMDKLDGFYCCQVELCKWTLTGKNENGWKMILRSPAYQLRCTLVHSAKFANHFFSRALTTLNHHIQNSENFVPSRNTESFTFHEGNDPLNFLANLSLLPELHRHGFLYRPRGVNKVVSACAKLGEHSVGIQIHAHVIKMGFCSNVYINSALLDMYCKCLQVEMAHNLFDEMPERNAVTWNSLISGYLETVRPKVAMCLFIEMLRIATILTPHSISEALVGSSLLEDGCLGTQVHALGIKFGFGTNVVVGTGLVDMYSKYSSIEESRRVFDRMLNKNVRSWTAMITGYAQKRLPIDAMILAKEMFRVGVTANYVTYNSLLCSFCAPDDLDHCKEIHCRIVREGFESNIYVAVTLVTVYSECGCSTEDFYKICSTINLWDQISWNAVIAGFSNLGLGEEALNCFTKMRQAGISVDLFTYASVLKAIGTISALEEGKQIHSLVIKGGYDSNLFAMNGLVSMFSRCGNLSDAKKVFSLMEEHDVVSWNSLLSGYAHHGYVEEIITIFEEMRRSRVKPNLTTFLILLSACSHFGLVEKGLEYFELMENDDSIPPPNLEHYACIVDLCGRAGYLEQAEAFIQSMSIEPVPSMLKALLSSCQVYGNKEIAVRCARRLVELSPTDPATFVVIANILACEGCWNDAEGVRKLMCDRQVRKKPGFSWV